jgi:hypothetical protein
MGYPKPANEEAQTGAIIPSSGAPLSASRRINSLPDFIRPAVDDLRRHTIARERRQLNKTTYGVAYIFWKECLSLRFHQRDPI